MNEEAKKRVLVFAVFGGIILFMVVYGVMTFGGDDSSSGQIAEMNPVFTTPSLSGSKLLNDEYATKLESYKEGRKEGGQPETKFDIPFYGESASPDSMAFVTEEERQQYIIDSLKYVLANSQSTPVPQKTTPQRARPVRRPQTVAKEPEPEKDPFADFDLNRTTNPLDDIEESNTEEPFDNSKYYNGKFVENTIITVGVDQSVNIRNTEAITLRDGTVIPRNTVMKGILSDVGNRLQIRVNEVETFDGTINAQLSVIHSDYQEGLPLKESSEMSEQSKDKVNDVLNQAANAAQIKIPFVSTPISLAPKFGTDNKEKILLPASMTFKLRILHQ